MPLILALRRQRQTDLHEFEASLIYEAGSGTARNYKEKPCLEKNKTKKQNKTKGGGGDSVRATSAAL